MLIEIHITPGRQGGARASTRREAMILEERKRLEDHEPIRIEAPVAEIKKSERVQREKQKPLFEELPDSPLPPLALRWCRSPRPAGRLATAPRSRALRSPPAPARARHRR